MAQIEVVDTNVWANLGKLPPEDAIEARCILSCLDWAKAFNEGGDDYQLAVDINWQILNEYRRYIKPGSLAEQYLNQLLSQPIKRLIFVQLEYDKDGHAVLEDPSMMTDGADRKFVAVALACDPIAPIVNATDTDWEENRQKLEESGLTIVQLCPDYIKTRLKR